MIRGNSGKNKIQAYQELSNRISMMMNLGYTFANNRNLYEALGYPQVINIEDYLKRYSRQDIAKAVIDRPIEATWKGSINIWETGKTQDTDLEKKWRDLGTSLKIKEVFQGLDKLTCLTNYGVLFLGLSDVSDVKQLVNPVNTKNKLKLLYIKPFGSDDAVIDKWETNPTSPRFGLPKTYKIKVTVPGATVTTQELNVHHTRVIHVVYDTLKSDIEGIPVLESVYNRLCDLEKLVGGSSEMYWRGARPGYQGKVDKDYQLTAEMEDTLQAQLDEYEHNLRRFLVNEGVTMEALASQVHDPVGHVEVQLQMISAVTRIPKRILVGSERGELSSNQDQESWLAIIQRRREEYAEYRIVRPFIETCIMYGILPQKTSETYSILWSDLFVMGEEQKAKVGQIRAWALKDYATQPGAETVVPPAAFFEFFLGLNPEQIEMITAMREEGLRDVNAGLFQEAADGMDEKIEPEPKREE